MGTTTKGMPISMRVTSPAATSVGKMMRARRPLAGKPVRRRRAVSLAAVASLAALALQAPVSAATLSCVDARQLVDQAEYDFARLGNGTGSVFGGVQSTLVLSGAEYCVITRSASQAAYRCRWRFDYRDPRAAVLYENVASRFVACLGNDAAVADDHAVNHPDTSDAYLFTLPHADVRLTLKDKRELDSTFVFFFVEGADPATPVER